MAKGILAVLGARPEDDDEDDAGGAEERAIRDFFEAGKKGDHGAATKAFKRAYRLCAQQMEAESGAGEEDDDEYAEE